MKNATKYFVLAMAAVTILFTACSPKEPEAETGGTIEFWTVFTGADHQNMQDMVDAYNATNPAFTVNHRAMEAVDLYLKLPLAVQSGADIPDVAINHIERIPLFVENDFLTDFTDIIVGTDIKEENYNPTPWGLTDLEGGHYGIPLDYHSYITYVNMDLYEQYGNDALSDDILTWDEIKGSAEAAMADGITPIGLGWLRPFFLANYGQLGGTLTSDGSTPVFTDNNAIEVLEMWQELYNAGYTQNEGDEAWKMFLGGEMLYMPEGIWMLNNAIDSGLNYKMVEFPAMSTSERGQWTSSHNFVIPKNEDRSAERTAAVLDFINFIGNNSLDWAKAGQVPAHNSIVTVEEFRDMPQFFLTEHPENLRMFNYKYYGYAVESLDKILPEVLFGRMTPEQGLQQAEQETKDRIAVEG